MAGWNLFELFFNFFLPIHLFNKGIMCGDYSHVKELPSQEKELCNRSEIFVLIISHGRIFFIDFLILASPSPRIMDKIFRVDIFILAPIPVKNRPAKVQQTHVQVYHKPIMRQI